MTWLETIGIAAFAVSGAMLAIDRDADIFGVLFLAVITALGGGVIRDILLGELPPRMFTSYQYILLALVSALIIFLDASIGGEKYRKRRPKLDAIVNIFDAAGLASFTVSGMTIAAGVCGSDNPVLLILLGMTTGVGGGMLRDVLLGDMSVVLRKRVYAVASLAGGLCYYGLLRLGLEPLVSEIAGMAVVFALRVLATIFRWNLPRAKR